MNIKQNNLNAHLKSTLKSTNFRFRTETARNGEVLVRPPAVPENIGGLGRKLHAPPGVIGKIAAKTGAVTLVLSHFMARSLVDGEENLNHIRSRHNGPVINADDLVCINL